VLVPIPIATSVLCQRRKTLGVAVIGRQSGGNRAAIGRQSGGSVIFHQIPFLTQCKGSTGRKSMCLSHIHVLVPIATSVSCQKRNKFGVAAIGRQSGGNRAEVAIFQKIPFLTQCKGSTGREQLCLSHLHVLVRIATSVSCHRRRKFGAPTSAHFRPLLPPPTHRRHPTPRIFFFFYSFSLKKLSYYVHETPPGQPGGL
jgi:hypothetical protein